MVSVPARPGANDADADAGRTIAGYRLLWRLGVGGFSHVWQGQHEISGELAAVKLIAPSASATARFQFRNEARAIAPELWHPHIVHVFDVGDDFLITAFIDGADLAHRLRTPLEPAQAVKMTVQIASALEHAHERGVVHCDVKPSNILVDGSDNAYLADFGVATFADDAEALIHGGTRGYMAPEQQDGERPTAAADQYALARTLLHMLLLELPSDEDPLTRLPTDLPEALRGVLTRALDPDPQQRFPAIGELARALTALDLEHVRHPNVVARLRRSTTRLSWCTRALAVRASTPGVDEADWRLQDLAGVFGARELAAFGRRSGYADLGFTAFVRADRLGPPDRREAIARADSLVVLLPGLSYSRDAWRPVAQAICRDNAQSVVIALDIHGFGESRYAQDPPARERLGPEGMLEGIRAFLDLLGVSEIPTCLVAHSLSTLPLLSVSDDELGPRINRLAISPLFPHVNPVWQRYCFGASILDRVPRLTKWALWPINLRRLRTAMAELDTRTREAAVREFERYSARTLGRAAPEWRVARPVPGAAMRRCKWLCGTDDAIVPRQVTEAAAADLGFDRVNLHWSISRDHYPHLPKRERPEETARNIDQIARLIRLLLRDVDRPDEANAGTVQTVRDPAAPTRTTQCRDNPSD